MKKKIKINKNLENEVKKSLNINNKIDIIDNNEKTIEYINKIKENHQFAGDVEINKMASLLNINILCYTLNDDNYELQGIYWGNQKSYLHILPLHFINNNHFEILYPKEFNNLNIKTDFSKEVYPKIFIKYKKIK